MKSLVDFLKEENASATQANVGGDGKNTATDIPKPLKNNKKDKSGKVLSRDREKS